ncbi:hypothetical protein J7T55_003655 [Diaporthe amygdali]|uniref:uncharacterized protein n=1 Tax=Phomopsis amygdali TaxID=1214568 RepID=UPI0022FE06E3|nr:uncharacterized protein J7T55_003655 [Diaporthe amygdali]KAJ0117245.1 hypothetical protein J7T55_003655 [Diaporthe amygdali]
MASPADAVAVPQLNGLADPDPQSQPQSDPSQSADPSAKRKREASDDGSAELTSINGNANADTHDNDDHADQASDHEDDDAKQAKPIVNGERPLRDESTLIRDYFSVLQRHDTTPSILKRPLPEPSNTEEPQAKRQKSDDDSKALCIADKVSQDSYKLLDQLVLDLKQVIQDRVAEMRSAQSADAASFDEDALTQLNDFRDTAMALHSREMSYPEGAPPAAKDGPSALDDVAQVPSNGSSVLTLFGSAQQPRTLFSSLPKRISDPEHPDGAVKLLSDVRLPNGLSLTTVLPSTSVEKPARVPTLGELFPSPANLPPLQPPKAPKTTTKSKILGFYHPELAERSRYRQGSYFSAELTTGAWLDYSNATPPSKNKSRQRERTLSLAGQKPSTADVEMTEMEALFRGAFSSFAPEKDDSGAIVPSGEVARIWYQRHGHRYMEQMIESELAGDEGDDVNDGIAPLPIDEDEIANIVETWDDSLIDPALTIDDVLGKKSDEEKEVDDTLQEISDLIETLSSYQRNRNMTLPTSQNRSSADPAKADMLNGPLAQEPTDEERDTYQILKDQLALIIQALPPYAVARLNSDRLEELNVSTKLEVRSDVFRGILDEESASARHRHHQQAAQAAQTPRQPQRTPSFHSTTPYQGQPYNRPYQTQNQTPVPIPNHYQQSPARPPIPPNFPRQVSAPMAGMTPQQHRPVAGQPFARPNGYTPQTMQQPRPYGTPTGVPQFQGSPGQPRMATGYPGAPQPGTPGQRYPSGYAGYNGQQPQPGMQPQYHQQPANYAPHMNGAGSIPPRTMSPQVPQYQAGQNYSPRPGQQPMPRGQPYGTPGQPGGHPGVPRYPSNGVQQNPPHSPAPGSGQGGWANPMSPQRQYEQQLQARNQAAARMNAFSDKIQNHSVAGLGGIGLGGTPAHMRTNIPGAVGQSSPSPRPVSAAGGMNGVPQPSPSPASVPGATPSPAPATAMQPQAPA